MAIPRTENAIGAINGANTSFTTPTPYTPGSLVAFLSGQLKRPDFDDGLIEDDPPTGTFTMKEPPLTGDVVQVRYLDTTPVAAGEEVEGLTGQVIELDSLTAQLSDLDALAASPTDLDAMSGSIDEVDSATGSVDDVDVVSGTVDDLDEVQVSCD